MKIGSSENCFILKGSEIITFHFVKVSQIQSPSPTYITSSTEEVMIEFDCYKNFQMQSAHNLTQALQLALQLSLTTVVKDASFHLLECVGNLDAHSCVQLLALYQVIHPLFLTHYKQNSIWQT